jgi:hypothetical protein
VRQQLADGDLVDGSVRVVYLAQLRHVAHCRIVQRKPPSVAQLQNGDGGQGLGDRSPVVAGLGIHRLAGFAPRRAVEIERRRLPAAHQRQSSAHHTVRVQHRAEPLPDGTRLRRSAIILRRGSREA